MRKCLLAVQGPLQFIAGYIAMEWYGCRKHDSAESEATLLLYDFAAAEDDERSMGQAIRTLSGIRHWSRVVNIDCRQMRRIMKQRYARSIRDLQVAVGEQEFDEVFLAREFGGAGSPLILNAYPRASRISYGDGFGVVGNEREFELPWAKPWTAGPALLRALARRVIYGSPKRFDFDAAVLTLPIDWSGAYSATLPLLVPPKEYALRLLGKFFEQLPELNAYCNHLLLEASTESYLFLLSNLSASDLMTTDGEIALYSGRRQADGPKGRYHHPEATSSQYGSCPCFHNECACRGLCGAGA